MAEPQAVKLAQDFQSQLRAADEQAILSMAKRWGHIESQIEGLINSLADQIAEMAEAGEPVTQSMLYQLDRYQSLLAQVGGEMQHYQAWAFGEIKDQAAAQQLEARRHAQRLLAAQAGPSPTQQIRAFWDRLNTSPPEKITALAQGGQPLDQILSKAYPLAVKGLTDKLLLGSTLGWHPRKLAREMMRGGGLDQGLNHILLVARDQQIRHYREATRDAYQASKVVYGYMRIAAKNPRTCMACIALDGTIQATSDVMALHPQDRCGTIPLVMNRPIPKYQLGIDWFKKQPEEVQHKMLGAGRFKLWKERGFDLKQMVTVKPNSVWGPNAQETPLKILKAGGGGQPRKQPTPEELEKAHLGVVKTSPVLTKTVDLSTLGTPTIKSTTKAIESSPHLRSIEGAALGAAAAAKKAEKGDQGILYADQEGQPTGAISWDESDPTLVKVTAAGFSGPRENIKGLQDVAKVAQDQLKGVQARVPDDMLRQYQGWGFELQERSGPGHFYMTLPAKDVASFIKDPEILGKHKKTDLATQKAWDLTQPDKTVTFLTGQEFDNLPYKTVDLNKEQNLYHLYPKKPLAANLEPMEKPPEDSRIHQSAGMILFDPASGKFVVNKQLGGFAGYNMTIPKGTLDPGEYPMEAAIREVWEETGFAAKIVGSVGDYKKTTSINRFYIGVVEDGAPWGAGWESPSVSLVPPDKLVDLLGNAADKKIASDFMQMYEEAKKLGNGDWLKGIEQVEEQNLKKKQQILNYQQNSYHDWKEGIPQSPDELDAALIYAKKKLPGTDEGKDLIRQLTQDLADQKEAVALANRAAKQEVQQHLDLYAEYFLRGPEALQNVRIHDLRSAIAYGYETAAPAEAVSDFEAIYNSRLERQLLLDTVAPPPDWDQMTKKEMVNHLVAQTGVTQWKLAQLSKQQIHDLGGKTAEDVLDAGEQGAAKYYAAKAKKAEPLPEPRQDRLFYIPRKVREGTKGQMVNWIVAETGVTKWKLAQLSKADIEKLHAGSLDQIQAAAEQGAEQYYEAKKLKKAEPVETPATVADRLKKARNTTIPDYDPNTGTLQYKQLVGQITGFSQADLNKLSVDQLSSLSGKSIEFAKDNINELILEAKIQEAYNIWSFELDEEAAIKKLSQLDDRILDAIADAPVGSFDPHLIANADEALVLKHQVKQETIQAQASAEAAYDKFQRMMDQGWNDDEIAAEMTLDDLRLAKIGAPGILTSGMVTDVINAKKKQGGFFGKVTEGPAVPLPLTPEYSRLVRLGEEVEKGWVMSVDATLPKFLEKKTLQEAMGLKAFYETEGGLDPTSQTMIQIDAIISKKMAETGDALADEVLEQIQAEPIDPIDAFEKWQKEFYNQDLMAEGWKNAAEQMTGSELRAAQQVAGEYDKIQIEKALALKDPQAQENMATYQKVETAWSNYYGTTPEAEYLAKMFTMEDLAAATKFAQFDLAQDIAKAMEMKAGAAAPTDETINKYFNALEGGKSDLEKVEALAKTLNTQELEKLKAWPTTPADEIQKYIGPALDKRLQDPGDIPEAPLVKVKGNLSYVGYSNLKEYIDEFDDMEKLTKSLAQYSRPYELADYIYTANYYNQEVSKVAIEALAKKGFYVEGYRPVEPADKTEVKLRDTAELDWLEELTTFEPDPKWGDSEKGAQIWSGYYTPENIKYTKEEYIKQLSEQDLNDLQAYIFAEDFSPSDKKKYTEWINQASGKFDQPEALPDKDQVAKGDELDNLFWDSGQHLDEFVKGLDVDQLEAMKAFYTVEKQDTLLDTIDQELAKKKGIDLEDDDDMPDWLKPEVDEFKAPGLAKFEKGGEYNEDHYDQVKNVLQGEYTLEEIANSIGPKLLTDFIITAEQKGSFIDQVYIDDAVTVLGIKGFYLDGDHIPDAAKIGKLASQANPAGMKPKWEQTLEKYQENQEYLKQNGGLGTVPHQLSHLDVAELAKHRPNLFDKEYIDFLEAQTGQVLKPYTGVPLPPNKTLAGAGYMKKGDLVAHIAGSTAWKVEELNKFKKAQLVTFFQPAVGSGGPETLLKARGGVFTGIEAMDAQDGLFKQPTGTIEISGANKDLVDTYLAKAQMVDDQLFKKGAAKALSGAQTNGYKTFVYTDDLGNLQGVISMVNEGQYLKLKGAAFMDPATNARAIADAINAADEMGLPLYGWVPTSLQAQYTGWGFKPADSSYYQITKAEAPADLMAAASSTFSKQTDKGPLPFPPGAENMDQAKAMTKSQLVGHISNWTGIPQSKLNKLPKDDLPKLIGHTDTAQVVDRAVEKIEKVASYQKAIDSFNEKGIDKLSTSKEAYGVIEAIGALKVEVDQGTMEKIRLKAMKLEKFERENTPFSPPPPRGGRPQPPLKPEAELPNHPDFPKDPLALRDAGKLGGTTGAKLVEDPATGKKYVLKKGGGPYPTEHVKNELYVDEMYRTMGLNVPKAMIYDTPEGPVKLAEFVEGGRDLGSALKAASPQERKKLERQLQDGFALDALVGNWDVAGASMDNILVDKDGTLWRIDNGGSLDYRAQGERKSETFGEKAWNGWVTDLWSMRDPSLGGAASHSGPIFQKMDWYEIMEQAQGIVDKEAEILAKVPEAERPILHARIEHMRDMASNAKAMRIDKYDPDFPDRLEKHGTNMKQDGLLDKLPRKIIQEGGDGVYVNDEKGNRWDNLRGKGSTIDFVAEYMETQDIDFSFFTSYMESQSGSSWNGAPLAVKYHEWIKRGQPANQFWNGRVQNAKQQYQSTVDRFGGEEKFNEAIAIWRAAVMEQARHIECKYNNKENGYYQIMRTEPRQALGGRIPNMGEWQEPIARGMMDSGSIYNTVRVAGDQLTLQLVPYHRIMAFYWHSNGPGKTSTPLYGDRENEFVCDFTELPFIYVGTVSYGENVDKYWTRAAKELNRPELHPSYTEAK